MRRVTASSPTRIDLAGGTLDIWPLNMLVDGALTVNVAIDLRATAVIEDAPPAPAGARASSVTVRSEDQQIEEVWERATAAPAGTGLPLHAACLRFFEPSRGFKLTTRSEAPAGSGLGGSSSLTVSLLGGLQTYLGRPMMPPDEMVWVARDLEAKVLEIPTGTQDHFAAAYGGAMAIRYGPGRPVREALQVDLDALGERLVLAYAGATRLSATANWDMMRRAVEKDERTRQALQAIATIARDMRAALTAGDLDEAGRLMAREWEQRQRLSDQVATPAIERAIGAARDAGAIAGKVCGAGGGGCIVFLCREGSRRAVEEALNRQAADGLKLLPARPTRVGLQVAA